MQYFPDYDPLKNEQGPPFLTALVVCFPLMKERSLRNQHLLDVLDVFPEIRICLDEA